MVSLKPRKLSVIKRHLNYGGECKKRFDCPGLSCLNFFFG